MAKRKASSRMAWILGLGAGAAAALVGGIALATRKSTGGGTGSWQRVGTASLAPGTYRFSGPPDLLSLNIPGLSVTTTYTDSGKAGSAVPADWTSMSGDLAFTVDGSGNVSDNRDRFAATVNSPIITNNVDPNYDWNDVYAWKSA